jgi:hypothetical protein
VLLSGLPVTSSGRIEGAWEVEIDQRGETSGPLQRRALE